MIYIVAIIFPPLAVLIKGMPGRALLTFFLTLFGWVPGIIYAWVAISRKERDQTFEHNVSRIKKAMES